MEEDDRSRVQSLSLSLSLSLSPNCVKDSESLFDNIILNFLKICVDKKVYEHTCNTF